MTNIQQAQEGMGELALENTILTKKLSKLKIVLSILVGILLVLGLNFNFVFLGFGAVFGFVGFLNVRYIQREVYMNNMMIVVAHSCVQSEFNSDYNPKNDTIITSKALIK